MEQLNTFQADAFGLSLEILLSNIHKKDLSRIKNEIGYISKMELFAKDVNCFCKELHLRDLFDRLPEICFRLRNSFYEY